MLGFSSIWNFQPTQNYFIPFWEYNIYEFELLNYHNIPISWISQTPLKIIDIFVPDHSEMGHKKMPSLASEIESQRQEAIKNLLNTCKKAQELKAKYVVLSPGVVSFVENLQTSSKSIISPTPQQLEMRRSIAAPYLERICRGLFQAIREYPEVQLCLLPAKYWYELPLLDELELIQSELSRYSIQYWHNTARVHFLEKAGFPGQEAWLAKYGKCTVGVHLEDVLDDKDLVPPGLGTIDWNKLKKYLPKKIPQILRLDSNFEANHVTLCLQYLQERNYF